MLCLTTIMLFDNMTLYMNIFNLQREADHFDDVDHYSFNWICDFSYDKLDFKHMV